MKKVFAFALSLGIIGAVAAQPKQSNNTFQNNKNDRYEVPKKQDNRYDDNRTAAVYNSKDYKDNRYSQLDNRNNQPRMNDRERQQEIDRINRDYDRRVAEYRNDRRLSNRDRNTKIQVIEKERSSKLGSFGGGLLLGGILGVLLSK